MCRMAQYFITKMLHNVKVWRFPGPALLFTSLFVLYDIIMCKVTWKNNMPSVSQMEGHVRNNRLVRKHNIAAYSICLSQLNLNIYIRGRINIAAVQRRNPYQHTTLLFRGKPGCSDRRIRWQFPASSFLRLHSRSSQPGRREIAQYPEYSIKKRRIVH